MKSREGVVFLLSSFLLVMLLCSTYRLARTVLVRLNLAQGGNEPVIVVLLLFHGLSSFLSSSIHEIKD